jgi:dissimilatory sulfite reductase (desulfoviridin) alpha/beta subunit
MQWTPEAEEAVQKVPFFVRKKVRARVENEARQAGKAQITLADVQTTQQRYLAGMSAEVKGYRIENCFGASGCPNQILPGDTLLVKIEQVLRDADLLGFLRSRGIREFKFHHELRVSLAGCPNACSQPQIKDIGIIAAARPRASSTPCSGCNACVDVCRESAIALDTVPSPPCIDTARCVACGQCMAVCPTGTLAIGEKGYRVQLGGKLGRHPQLARELPKIYDEAAVVAIVQACLDIYKRKNRRGERFGELLQEEDLHQLADRFA